jgi:hypothetical protein
MKEPEAKALFESAVPADLFTTHRECSGSITTIKPIKKLFIEWGKSKASKRLRIDYILEPTQKLLNIGWELGSVGVEVKKVGGNSIPDKREGKILAQLFDYQSATFQISNNPVEQSLSMIFLFQCPFVRFGGLMASIMMQVGLGVVRCYPNSKSFELLHGNGMHPILKPSANVPYRRPRFGYASGSR